MALEIHDKRSRDEQIAEIERLTRTENISSLVDYLTENPDIPVEDLEKQLREGVLIALLTEAARKNDTGAITGVIKFLLEQRRNNLKSETDEPETDEPEVTVEETIEETRSEIKRTAHSDGEPKHEPLWLDLDLEEWPFVEGKDTQTE